MQVDVYDIMIKTLVNMWDSLKADPVFLIFVIAIVVIAFLKAIKTPVSRKEKGAYGEKHIEIELNRLSLFGRNGKKLRNIYIPKDDGSTSEIDVLYITQKGIFVFESKNCKAGSLAKRVISIGRSVCLMARRTNCIIRYARTDHTSSG